MTKDTSVLLYSGGLDSYCAAVLLQPDVLLAVDTGTVYGAVELERLATPPGMEARLLRVDFSSLGQLEREDDLILPGRNAHLVLLAAAYGDTIYLAATAGDRVTDKDAGFQKRVNLLLDHLYQPQWWLPGGRDVGLDLAVKHMTKRQLVAAALEAGATADELRDRTFSCYYPTGLRACGACKPCVRRYVALLCNGVRPDVDCGLALEALVTEATSDRWDRGEGERADVLLAWEQLGGELA